MESQAELNVTVVIPALNAAQTLGKTLATLRGVADVIVVDGGSRDVTRDVARQGGARVVSSKTGRGCQLAEGARAAAQDWLLFLHADTRLEPGWIAIVEGFTSDPKNRLFAATFCFKLDEACWQARFLEGSVRFRAKRLGLPYGDQGLLIHRDLYATVGGYPDWPLMEDVEIVRKIGRRRLVSLPVSATTSAAKWRRDGWFARSARNLVCLSLYYVGVSPKLITRIYG